VPDESSGPKRPPRPRAGRERSDGAERSGPAPLRPSTPAAAGTATIAAPPAGRTSEGADDTNVTPVPPNGFAGPPPPAPPAEAPPEPTAVASSSRRRARRGRRVKRVVRRIDLWSVLKLSLVVYTCLYLAILATIAALWGIAYSSGTIENLESFLADVGLENYRFYGNQMFRACAAIGAIGVMAGTVVTVLATALVNVISEMTGGIRLVVIEEDVDR
jgi:hypothetical protein